MKAPIQPNWISGSVVRQDLADWIHLRRLEVGCVLGVYPRERKRQRTVWMDVALAVDTRRAAQSDRLGDTLNYEQIESAVIEVAREGKFHLVEALASAVAEVCLAWAGVRAVRVVVDKPKALTQTASVAVEIYREKEEAAPSGG